MGDVHPLGNPHVHLDPHNVALVAAGLAARLAAVDAANAKVYEARAADFQARWRAAIARSGRIQLIGPRKSLITTAIPRRRSGLRRG